LESIGSYGPIFAVASCAYLIALAVIHLILPRYQPVDSAPSESRS
jgi:ACS family hexuronate transporter-like MFS transporter